MVADLLAPIVVLFVYFTLWFCWATFKKRLDYVDIAWGGGFIAVVITELLRHKDSMNIAQAIICVCVVLWGARLSLHLGRWVFSNNIEDPRYAEIRKNWKGSVLLRSYTNIFLLQAVLVWLISLPLMSLWQSDLKTTSGVFLGLAIWIIGFIYETIADRQLRKFTNRQSNKGKVLKTGLWKFSRHPNYFGELAQWWGIWLMSLYVYPVWWSVIGPLTLTILIRFVSGVPPLEKRKANDKDYQKYKLRTPMLIPAFPKKA
jgi:steroid 5-alpha reductase family enzyme